MKKLWIVTLCLVSSQVYGQLQDDFYSKEGEPIPRDTMEYVCVSSFIEVSYLHDGEYIVVYDKDGKKMKQFSIVDVINIMHNRGYVFFEQFKTSYIFRKEKRGDITAVPSKHN